MVTISGTLASPDQDPCKEPEKKEESKMRILKILAITSVFLFASAPAPFLSFASSPDEYVKAHNKHRAKVGSPPLEWSQKLADCAQDWANKLVRGQASGHRPNDQFKKFVKCAWDYCGENIWQGRGKFKKSKAHTAVDGWVKYEERWFDKSTCACTTGKNGCNDDMCCYHYTQVVSALSREVGCAFAKSGGKAAVVCNYKPGGNIRDGGKLRDLFPGCGAGGDGQAQSTGGGRTQLSESGGGLGAQSVFSAIKAKCKKPMLLDSGLSSQLADAARGKSFQQMGAVMQKMPSGRLNAFGVSGGTSATDVADRFDNCEKVGAGNKAGIYVGDGKVWIFLHQ